ncbi:sirohydrochlorin chelatase [Cellulosimicrobium cellulans]|uniref:sirohydrochlorin chelatase n=1 Tax=Cellulosimicrobium cellulans TaxID=1710 RepID=UPI001964FD07|nr:CbiX/SirB N-terminal domain-containing protein [Cellulosimicrobium cellulans]MBN0039019.1 sirohydrochlorin chelatase [Cellulosimicrobium cellulans]
MSAEIVASPSGASSDSSSGDVGRTTPASVLIGCSHGTSDLAGRDVIRALLDDVRAARPDLDVREAFVDVQQPEVADVVTSVVAPAATEDPDGSAPDAGEPGDAVVVPLLLSGGFHVSVDVAAAVEDRGPGTGRAAASTPLGPDPRLVDLLAERLADVGLRPEDAVVVAAAGSSRPGAARDVEELAAGLRERVPGPVTVGYGAMAEPSVPDAVAAARADLAPGGRVVVAAYLLAPGFFYDRVLEAGGDVVTAPLAPDARLTAIVLDRYATAAATLAQPR